MSSLGAKLDPWQVNFAGKFVFRPNGVVKGAYVVSKPYPGKPGLEAAYSVSGGNLDPDVLY